MAGWQMEIGYGPEGMGKILREVGCEFHLERKKYNLTVPLPLAPLAPFPLPRTLDGGLRLSICSFARHIQPHLNILLLALLALLLLLPLLVPSSERYSCTCVLCRHWLAGDVPVLSSLSPPRYTPLGAINLCPHEIHRGDWRVMPAAYPDTGNPASFPRSEADILPVQKTV